MTTELIPIFTGEIAGQLVPVFNARDLAIGRSKGTSCRSFQCPGGAP
jgi:hypothetical protein